MGDRGARRTAAASERADVLVHELAPLGDIRSRSMFGGYGIFAGDTMFALVDSSGTAFLRADDELAEKLSAAGSDRHGRMPYWSLPPETAERPDELRSWAEAALRIARRAAG